MTAVASWLYRLKLYAQTITEMPRFIQPHLELPLHYNRFTALLGFVRDHPGEPVPER